MRKILTTLFALLALGATAMAPTALAEESAAGCCQKCCCCQGSDAMPGCGKK